MVQRLRKKVEKPKNDMQVYNIGGGKKEDLKALVWQVAHTTVLITFPFFWKRISEQKINKWGDYKMQYITNKYQQTALVVQKYQVLAARKKNPFYDVKKKKECGNTTTGPPN